MLPLLYIKHAIKYPLFRFTKRCFASERNHGQILYQKIENNSIGMITLNDPKRLNALTASMGDELMVRAISLLNQICGHHL